MKLRRLFAAGATGVALAFGVIGGGLGVASATNPYTFEGHDPAWCTQLHDGSLCFGPDGIFEHLEFAPGTQDYQWVPE